MLLTERIHFVRPATLLLSNGMATFVYIFFPVLIYIAIPEIRAILGLWAKTELIPLTLNTYRSKAITLHEEPNL